MSKQVRLQQMYNVMEEMLNSGGTVNFNPRGYSMCPTLRNDGDRVVIKKINSLKKYDLPLYIRPDGSFVLHRVISVNKDGTYNICGDNQPLHYIELYQRQMRSMVSSSTSKLQ